MSDHVPPKASPKWLLRQRKDVIEIGHAQDFEPVPDDVVPEPFNFDAFPAAVGDE